jgi:cytochrome c biogenesis protein
MSETAKTTRNPSEEGGQAGRQAPDADAAEEFSRQVEGHRTAKDSGDSQDVTLPALGFKGMLRWGWTQLTSMRTALFLLLLLAVAAVPGSLFPQRPANPAVVTQYIEDNPATGPWLDRFQLFDVYSSVWFSAIYLLLFISLIGCVIPRAIQHWKAVRSQPPRTPRRLSRLPEYGALALDAASPVTAASAVEDAARLLKRRGYRVQVRGTDTGMPSVGAERGFLKEVGNLVFHVSLIGVLVSVAAGGLFGYRGQKVIVEGDSFVNTLVGYDNFSPGTNFSESQLAPFSLQLDKFQVQFDRESKTHYGQPLDFTATMTTQDGPDAAPQQQTLKVNSPLEIGGTQVYLVGNGYAPVVTVRDGDGNIAHQGPVVAVPSDSAYTSTMVLKVPDAKPEQLGFVGLFLPTALENEQGVAFGSDPDPFNPRLYLNSYAGDLGLDKGEPKNVYVLDTTKLKVLNDRTQKSGGIVLGPKETFTLPDGLGTITFDGLKRYVALDITADPGQGGALLFSTLALAGLCASLFIGRRRVWVRAGTHPDGRTMVEWALLARGEDHRLAAEAAALRKLLEKEWLARPDRPADNSKKAGAARSGTKNS